MQKLTAWMIAGLVVGALAIAQQSGVAQGPVAGQPGGRGGSGGRGGGGGATNVRSNEQIGVNIDRFIGDPLNSPAHLSHGGLVIHNILSAGNPYEGGATGAVLEYRK